MWVVSMSLCKSKLVEGLRLFLYVVQAGTFGGCDCVATKSVLKNINIKTRDAALLLVNALENAKGKHTQQVKKTCVFSDASREEIRKMFFHRLGK